MRSLKPLIKNSVNLFPKFLKIEYVSIDGALNSTQNSTAASEAVRVLAKDTLSRILFYGWMILPFVSISMA